MCGWQVFVGELEWGGGDCEVLENEAQLVKNFAKLNECRFHLICSEEPTDLCQQENDINIFDCKIILPVG